MFIHIILEIEKILEYNKYMVFRNSPQEIGYKLINILPKELRILDNPRHFWENVKQFITKQFSLIC